MTNETRYYKSVDFDKNQEYSELGIKKTNQLILVNHGELVIYLLNYNKKIPIEVEQITIDEHQKLFADENYFGRDWIDDRLTDLTIKEARKKQL